MILCNCYKTKSKNVRIWFIGFLRSFALMMGDVLFLQQKERKQIQENWVPMCVYGSLYGNVFFWGWVVYLYLSLISLLNTDWLTSIFSLSFSLFCLQLQSRNSGMSRWMDFLGGNRKGESKIIWKKVQKWSPKDETTLSHFKISNFSLLYYSILKIKFAFEKKLCIFVSKDIIAVVKIDCWNEGSVD